jgi:hypothetical protein
LRQRVCLFEISNLQTSIVDGPYQILNFRSGDKRFKRGAANIGRVRECRGMAFYVDSGRELPRSAAAFSEAERPLKRAHQPIRLLKLDRRARIVLALEVSEKAVRGNHEIGTPNLFNVLEIFDHTGNDNRFLFGYCCDTF